MTNWKRLRIAVAGPLAMSLGAAPAHGSIAARLQIVIGCSIVAAAAAATREAEATIARAP
jgi:hypothetical protein